jgi:hypothetical protein
MKKATTKSSSKVTATNQIEELTAEIAKYHGWCLEWRRLNDALEEEVSRLQYMYCDAQAVIAYLENKIGG